LKINAKISLNLGLEYQHVLQHALTLSNTADSNTAAFDRWLISLGFGYALGPKLTASFRYQYTARMGGGEGSNYTQSLITFGLNYAF
jgi:predicted porin